MTPLVKMSSRDIRQSRLSCIGHAPVTVIRMTTCHTFESSFWPTPPPHTLQKRFGIVVELSEIVSGQLKGLAVRT